MRSDSAPAPDPAVDARLLHPALGLAALVVVLVGLASLRQPLGPWLPWIAAAAIGGLGWSLRRSARLALWWWLAAGVSWAVLVVISQLVVPWPAISTNPDAWSYGAMSLYLTDYARGVTQGMPLVDQFASHLRNTRFASGGLLALAAFFTGRGNPFASHTVFYVFCIITLFFSTGYLGGTLGLSRRQSLLAAALVALLGWTADAIIVASYDNLVFVALWPAVLGVVLQFYEGKMRLGPFIAIESVLGAAIVCAYPEALGIAAVLVFPLACFMVRRRGRSARFWMGLGTAGLVALLLAAPYLPMLIPLLRSQLTISASGGNRPGEGYFTGLLGSGFAPAFFSLGSEFPGASTSFACDLLPLAAAALIVLGAWRLALRWPWYPWAGVCLLALLLWQAVGKHYSYGGYKVIFCASWWIYPAMVSGGAWLIDRWSHPRAGLLAAAGLCAAAAVQQHSQWRHRIWPPDPHLSEMTELASLRYVSQGHPVLLNLDSDFEEEWATTLLRTLPLALDHPHGYLAMPHVQAYLARARPVPGGAGMYVLRSGPAPNAAWQNRRFSLLREFDAFIAAVDNPNGLETMDGGPFIWIAASRPTIFSITAFQGGPYELEAQAFLFGPSAPASPTRVLEISDATGTHVVELAPADSSISVNLRRGDNAVAIRSRTPATVDRLPNGDTRELMLGLKGYFLRSKFPATAPAGPRP